MPNIEVYARSFCTWLLGCPREGALFWITTSSWVTICKMYVCPDHMSEILARGYLLHRVEN